MDAPQAPAASTDGGLVLAPFRAWYYDPSRAGSLADLTAPPYGILTGPRRARLEAEPHNVVHLILPRDAPGEPGSRYRRAADTLRAWQQDGVLRRADGPALYVYEERSRGHVQRGLIGAVELPRTPVPAVLPHEDTMPGPVEDRLALVRATRADLEPIFCVYDGGGVVSSAIAGTGDRPPLLSARTEDGLEHRVWPVTDLDCLARIAADLAPRRAVIADGHHRWATYLRYRDEQHRTGAGPGPWDRGLAYLVDASSFGPEVAPIHRVVRGLPLAAAVALASAGFRVTPLDDAPPVHDLGGFGAPRPSSDPIRPPGGDAVPDRRPDGSPVVGAAFVLAGRAGRYLLDDPDPRRLASALPPGHSAAWRALDVAAAHAYLIRGLWGLPDASEVTFAESVQGAVAGAGDGVALLMRATPLSAVVAVVSAGERMPRKSTLFLPKPRTGLLLRSLEP